MIKNHLLYQLSYAGDFATSFTILWYARQESNLQPSGSKPDALSS